MQLTFTQMVNSVTPHRLLQLRNHVQHSLGIMYFVQNVFFSSELLGNVYDVFCLGLLEKIC